MPVSLQTLGGDLHQLESDMDSNKECTYFTRTGCCSFGNDCKFRHDPSKVLPLAGYTENGYPLRPGCELCTFYTATGWCNHWFSCSKDHDTNRLAGECKESLPPPTIMEQFHRFKYHSFTKEYKPLSTNHLPPAIRDKRWIVGNEYGQSAIPRSAQNRILQSFKNGVPEDVKNRLYRFLPQETGTRNMQLLRTNTGGYMTTVPPSGAMLSRAMSAPHQYIPTNTGIPVITSKVMTPNPLSPTTTINQPQQQPQYGAAAAAAGYHPAKLPSYSLDNQSNIASQHPHYVHQHQQRYYTMVPQAAQPLPAYSPIYPAAYPMEAPAPCSSPLQDSPQPYYYPTGLPTPPPPPHHQPPPPTTAAYMPPSTHYSGVYAPPQQQVGGQYQYVYGAGMEQYQMPPHMMSYPQHSWTYANVETSGDSSGQTVGAILEDQDVVESAFKGYPKMSDDHGSVLEEDVDDIQFYDNAF